MDTSDQLPRAVGSYRVVGRLGAGGMGEVLLARSAGGRLVAVKVIHRHLANDPEFRERFAREVRAARSVGGFYTAAVVDADVDAPSPWLASEYVPAPSIRRLVAERGPLPVESVLALAAGVAEALSTIHAAGITHRDLKPDNVLVTASGPRVIDFGIARLSEQTQTLTATGEILGTPAYMSPEQVLGEEIGPATDVFSLGSILTFAATGHGPFDDATVPLVLNRVAYNDPDLSALPEGQLRDIVLDCLRKSPDSRPGAAQLLSAVQSNQPDSGGAWLPPELRRAVAAAPPVTPVRTGGPRRRAVLAAGTVAAAGLLSAGSYAAVRWFGHLSDPGHATAARGQGTMRWKTDIGATAGPLGSTVSPPAVVDGTVYAQSVAGAVHAVDAETGTPRWKRDMGGELTYPPIAAAGKVFACNGPRGLFALDAGTGAVLWESPDYKGMVCADAGANLVYASLQWDAGIGAVDMGTGAQRWTALTDHGGGGASFATGGGHVVVTNAVMDGGWIAVLDSATGAVRWLDDNASAAAYERPVIAGETVYYLTSGALVARDIATGAPRWQLKEVLANEPVILDDTVYVCGSTLYALDAATGRQRWEGPTGQFRGAPAAAGNSVYVVTVSTSSSPAVVSAIDIHSGATQWTFTLPASSGAPAAASGSVYLACGDHNLYALNA